MNKLILFGLFTFFGFKVFAQEDSTKFNLEQKWINIDLREECCQILGIQTDYVWLSSNCIIEFMREEEKELWDY